MKKCKCYRCRYQRAGSPWLWVISAGIGGGSAAYVVARLVAG